jgi:hypothetical protein
MALNSAIQTTYADGIGKAFPGMVADQRPQVRSSVNIQDAAGVAFGKPVFRGTLDHCGTGLLAADETTARFLGVTIADVTQAEDKYPQHETAGVLNKGPIWVNTAVAVAQGDPVYITQAETWSNVTSADAFLVPDAEWDTTNTAAGLAVLLLK